MTHKIRGVRVEEYAYYVNKLRQNVGLETWIWRQIVTKSAPQIHMTTIRHWMKPSHENFLRTPLLTIKKNHLAREGLGFEDVMYEKCQ